MEGRERTWGVASTQPVAGNLANKRNHVCNLLPGSVDYLHNIREVLKIPV